MIAKINDQTPIVIRNDQTDLPSLQHISFDCIVISPGPGTPERREDIGVTYDILSEADVPIFGVCLGHQALGYVYGCDIIRAPEIFHGRISEIYHSGCSQFAGIPQGFKAVRYHSLIVKEQLPPVLEKTAWTENGLIMGIRHKHKPIWGVQFHPESICTEYGETLMQNFFYNAESYYKTENIPLSKNGIDISAQPPLTASERTEVTEKTPVQPESYVVSCREVSSYYDSESVFLSLYADDEYAFWLDSSKVGDGLSRFSYMGSNAGTLSKVIYYNAANKRLEIIERGEKETISGLSVFDYLEEQLRHYKCGDAGLPFDFTGGFAGYFGYELKQECGGVNSHAASTPDAAFILSDRLVVFDHLEQKLYLVAFTRKDDIDKAEGWFDQVEPRLGSYPFKDNRRVPAGGAKVLFRLGRSHEQYIEDIEKVKSYLTSGDSYEVNLTNRLHTRPVENPLQLYLNLRNINPAPYSAFLRFDDIAVLSSSPEKFLQISSGGIIEAKPIKGTIGRSADEAEDLMLKRRLQSSEKDFSENLMIVDLMRNDLGIVCEIDSVHAAKLMEVETFETVHQLVSTIRGKVKPGLSAIACIKAAFPAGSMTGAPKIRTLEIIDDLETEARGIYSGSIGFLSFNGSADLNVVIRTIVCTPQRTTIGVGGAITMQSDSELEYDEMMLKAHALIKAIAVTEQGSESGWSLES